MNETVTYSDPVVYHAISVFCFNGSSFGRLGSTVVCCDINSVGNEQTVQEIKELGGTAVGYVFDCSDRDAVYEAANKIKNDVGDVDILINNAGIVTGKKFMDTPDNLALKTFEVNSIAHFWVRRQIVLLCIVGSFARVRLLCIVVTNYFISCEEDNSYCFYCNCSRTSAV